MRSVVVIFFLAMVCTDAISAQLTFREKYNVSAKDMVPALQLKACKTIQAKTPGKEIIECDLKAGNSLLSLDSMNKKLTGVWLMLDSTQLEHPSDLTRAGGMLLRAARGTSYGDYLAVSSDVFNSSRKIGWKESCVDDSEAQSRFCVSSDDGRVFNITLTPIHR